MLGSVRSCLLSALFSCTGLTVGFRFPAVPQAEAGVSVEKSPWGTGRCGKWETGSEEDGSQPARASETPSSAQNRQQHWWPWGR